MIARRRIALLLALAAAAACGDDPGPDPPPGPIPSMLIENQSQYRLRELRLHTTPDYQKTPNAIPEELELAGALVYYGAGEHWVTVFREKYAMGPILAFTTATPVHLERGRGYRLSVFDESFRLEAHSYLDPDEVAIPIIGSPQ